MDKATVEVYEDRGELWAARRKPVRRAAARAFAAAVPAAAGVRADLGCGSGRYTAALGPRVVGLDAARDDARPVPHGSARGGLGPR